MKIKDLKIRTKLKLGFGVLVLLVILLGITTNSQTDKLYQQIETMYNHPLQVRRAIGNLNSDIMGMRLGRRDLMLATNTMERQAAIQLMEISAANALGRFNLIKEHYLGPSVDIEEAYKAFITWKIAREENTKLVLSGDIEKVKESVLSTGAVGTLREEMLARIKIIDDFATNKGDALYANSRELKNFLNRQLILVTAVILLLSFLISYLLLRALRQPIDELTDVVQRFHKGDLNVRSANRSQNEFSVLSASFNAMMENIELKTYLDERFAGLAVLMLSEYDMKKFFQTTLNALAAHTGSQMAAVYLLSDDKKSFEHFESLGVDDNVRQSFAAERFEGEFGAVLSTRKVQHIKNIPQDTRFIFHTVSGRFIPREIITLPILADNEVVAIISLSSVSVYSQESIQLIDRILVTLCARVEGILAYHKIKEFSEKLEHQNSELEAQKVELSSQSAELIEQNSELEMQKNQLDEASRLKTNFLSNMSHELRTPLNSVIALSGVLNRRLARQIPEEEYSYLEVIERNGKNLLKLINDILDISRIEAGQEEIEITNFNANTMIADVVSMIKPQAEQKNIQLLHTDSGSNLTIASDMDKCHHILQNLIGNALKFTEKGRVEIFALQGDNNLTITVIDTGLGIFENHLAHIFDEFRQADGSTSRRFGGTGLGLAIAKKYANLLGGTIGVKSTPGKGSEFILTLPLIYAVENRITEAEPTTSFNHGIKKPETESTFGSTIKTILLVEDSDPAIIQIKDFLEESGYQILVAHDGGEALEIISKTIPDAMILDLMMPGIDGFKVLKILREAEPTAHIPVLILTAKHITKEELLFLKRNNIHQLIQKGDINASELLNAVATMVTPKPTERAEPGIKVQTIEGKPVVLVVEDNPDNMTTVKAILADNYTVLGATDGYGGIEMAKKHLPHLILMDIELPGLNGIEAFKIIRNTVQLQHIPVIALTASALTTDREAILAHGFNAYIPKPIDEHVFFREIEENLYGR